MIGRIRGMLASSRGGTITMDVDGIGYEVTLTPRDVASLPGIGEEIVVHTHTHVREDEISLYGFAAEADRELFRVLLTASGVGPKLAMAMLASLTATEIILAITHEDADALTVTSGVGKRGAQKIVLELAPRLAGREVEIVGGSDLVDVRSALDGLGYTTAEINSVVGGLNPDDSLELQVKTALQSLGKQRHA